MSLLQAILLGLIQGATEFLPISSSAHLILLPRLMEWPDQGLLADAAANSGTLVAVILYFWQDLRGFVRDGVRFLTRRSGGVSGPRDVLFLKVLMATVPVALFGFFGYDFIAGAARDPRLIAVTSIGFGLVLWATDLWGRKNRDISEMGWVESMSIGVLQAVALIPGTSRSGITMSGALGFGFDRETAARFSFLLAIPVGLLVAANDLLSILKGEAEAGQLVPLLVIFVISAVVGYAVIELLLAWLRRQKMTVFAVYRILLGIVLLVLF